MTAARRTRILILGGGNAGVPAARRLLKARKPADNVDLTIISRDTAEVWHGLLPQIVSGLVQPHSALVSLRETLPGATVYPYEITQIDLVNKCVRTSPGGERDEVVLPYDFLLIALGSVTNLTRFPGLVEHGFQTKTIGDIVHLRNHMLDMLERASVEHDANERRRMLTFVVAGAGFAGVEFASQVNDYVRSALSRYPQISRAELRFLLVGHGKRILPALSERLARRALQHMRQRGIDVRLGVGVDSVTATTAMLSNGERIPTRTVIVTAGISPNPLIASLPVELAQGRVVCDDYCRVKNWSGVYAAGDSAAVRKPTTKQQCPPTFLYAMSQGMCAADNMLRELRHEPPRRYAYQAIGELAFLSNGYAVATLKGVPLHGVVASLIGRCFFLAYIPTWRRRIGLLVDWLSASVFASDITQIETSRSDTIVPMRFDPGDVIVREGEPGSRFYIIAEGTVEVVRQLATGEEQQLDVLGPGQYFGEMALLHAGKRMASVRAVTHTRVLSIARDEFSALVSHLAVLRDAVDEKVRLSQRNLAAIQPSAQQPNAEHKSVDQRPAVPDKQ